MQINKNTVSIPCALGRLGRVQRRIWNGKHWVSPNQITDAVDKAKRVEVLAWLENGNGRVVVRQSK